MCGRFSLAVTPESLAESFGIEGIPAFPPRYNIAPTQPVAVVLQMGNELPRQFRLMRWGLIPAWAKDPAIGNRLINARAETLTEKNSFRNAFKRRRCLIPADGFYEWKKVASAKQPYFFQLRDGQAGKPDQRRPFAFAGLWETWQDIETCTIITTAANELLREVHDRMPVILDPEDYADWLDPANSNPATLQKLLRPYPAAQMASYPVSTRVNSPAIDDGQCIQPIEPGE